MTVKSSMCLRASSIWKPAGEAVHRSTTLGAAYYTPVAYVCKPATCASPGGDERLYVVVADDLGDWQRHELSPLGRKLVEDEDIEVVTGAMAAAAGRLRLFRAVLACCIDVGPLEGDAAEIAETGRMRHRNRGAAITRSIPACGGNRQHCRGMATLPRSTPACAVEPHHFTVRNPLFDLSQIE